MRALVCAIGQLGHLNPMLSLARGLARAGHDVRVATGPDMAGYVRAAGVPLLPVGQPGELRPSGLTEMQGRRLIATLTPAWVRDLERLTAGWRPDVVIRQWMEGASLVLATRLGVPQVVCEVCLRLPPEHAHYHPAAETVRRHGLDPRTLLGDLWLSCYPPSFARPGSPRLAHEHHIRPLLYDGAAAAADPAAGRPRPGPLVYATLGTMYNKATSVFDRLVDAYAGEDYPVLITTGPELDPGSVRLGPRAANIRLARYVPHTRIVPAASAVISHGGFNTVMCALAQGVPMGLIPLGSDHGTNTRRCTALGTAIGYPVSASEPYVHVRPADLDPVLLREMTRTLLADDRYRQAARRVQREIAGLPGTGHVVGLIERLARPQPALRQNTAE
jgi:UDP:flavonoid glycosyltransferase YjiC (YdhE family)